MTPAPLPPSLLRLCDEDDGVVAAELLTVDEARWPHLAHLSAGEVVVDSDGCVRVATWAKSQSTANLERERQAVLMTTSPEGVFEVRCQAEGLPLPPGFEHLHAFRLLPTAVRDKSAPYADIVSGVQFRLHQPEEARVRWRAVRDLLIQAQPAA